MKYLFIAGERSGDMHAARVIKEIRKIDLRAEIFGVGGDYMVAEGISLIKHYKEFSFMGIVEVLSNLSTIKKTLKDLKASILSIQPDVLILVDFPGINLKLATYAKENSIKTCYYISPKIWAWKEHRIKRIKRDVDKMFVILPFEKTYFDNKNYEVEYVGNPLVEMIKQYDFEAEFSIDESKQSIAVLPGSRKQEIVSSAKVVNEIVSKYDQIHFHIAGVDNVDASLYEAYKPSKNLEIHFGKTYDLLKQCNAAIVTSGTATLETALLNCPQVVVYRANPISVFIAKLLVKIKWISLVNLIANKAIVIELIQENYNADAVMKELDKILNNHQYTAAILSDYQELKEMIGSESASKNVSKKLIAWLDPDLI